jgi:DNA-binding NarL/FixJ family response regulator
MPQGLLLCDDLIFASRIAGAARAAGLEVRQARTPDALVDMARREPPQGVLIDLGFPDLDLVGLLRRLAEACPALPRVVAYGSHVDAAGLHAARAAGCDLVLPRSKFVEDLPQELRAWLAPRHTDPPAATR